MKNYIYYLIIAMVVVTWGFDPVVNSYLYSSFSASALSSLATFCSVILLFCFSFKKLRLLDKRYFMIAVPICTMNSVACVLQKIGLQYTSPASYAFLEQLACVVVPIALFIFTRKRPSALQCIASVICLVGCFVFSGMLSGGLSFGIGEILCGLAGIIFGFCIASTGIYTKGLDIRLYMLIHMTIYFLVSALTAVSLNFITKDGVPLEKFVFAPDAKMISIAVLWGLFAIGVCWLLRTEALRNVNPAVVAVMCPFSAVITSTVSLIIGLDKISTSFVVGALLIFTAMALSAINDIKESKKKEQ